MDLRERSGMVFANAAAADLSPKRLGLLGFDSRDNGFVSMQADAPEALKTDAEQ